MRISIVYFKGYESVKRSRSSSGTETPLYPKAVPSFVFPLVSLAYEGAPSKLAHDVSRRVLTHNPFT